MKARIGTIALAIVVFAFGAATRASAQSLPGNLTLTDSRLRPVVWHLLTMSKTVRAQIAAIERSENLMVIVTRPADRSSSLVRTRLQAYPYDTGMIVATIELPVSAPPEMLGHAFEHVIECVERRDPEGWPEGNRRVFHNARGSFETVRAREAERAVRYEITQAASFLRTLLENATRAGEVPQAADERR